MKKEKIIELIKSGEMTYDQVSIFKRNDLDIIAAYISVADVKQRYELAKKYKDNLEVMTKLIIADPKLYTMAGKKVKNDYEFAKLAVSLYGMNYLNLSSELKKDANIIYATIENNHDYITLINEELLDERDTAYAVLSVNPTFWNKIGKNIKQNSDFLVEVAIMYPDLIPEFGAKWADSDRIFYWACRKDGMALRYASKVIKDNENIVTIATSQNPMAVEFASSRIRSDKNYMMQLMEKDPRVVEFANANLLSDPHFMLCAVESNPDAIRYISKSLLHNEEFLLSCVEVNQDAAKVIRDVKAIEARSYKLKSIKSDDVQVRNGVVFGVKLDEEKNHIYATMMKKSFTSFLDGLTHEELLVLDRLVKAEANIIVEKIKKEGKDNLTERDIRTIAVYRKIYLRVKQLKLKENDYDRSKVDMTKCYGLVDTAYNIADKAIRI